MTHLEQYIEQYPEKYFKVPPNEEIDLESHSCLMERIEALNELVECLTEGNQVDADEGLINILSQIMGVFIYEAKQIMSADLELRFPTPHLDKNPTVEANEK